MSNAVPLSERLAPTPLDASLDILAEKLLGSKNGFYVGHKSLLVRPLRAVGPISGVLERNAPDGWKSFYEIDLSSHVFFAENLLGEQFSLCASGVYRFDPETAELECVGASLEDWAKWLLSDLDFVTGRPLAEAWVRCHGPLPDGVRLLPRVPLVLGGDFGIDNMVAVQDFTGMKSRSELANQLRGLSDGAEVVIDIVA